MKPEPNVYPVPVKPDPNVYPVPVKPDPNVYPVPVKPDPIVYPVPIAVKLSLRPPLNEENIIEFDKDIKDFVRNVNQSEAEFIDELLENYPELEAIKP